MLTHSIDSYGTSTTSSTPDDQSRSVLQNTSSDKDQERQQHSEENTNNNNHSDSLENNSDKVISDTVPSSTGVALSEKNLEFDSALYNTAVDSLFTQNNPNNRYDFHSTGIENSWPYDLSRTSGTTLDFPQSASSYYSAPNFRNHYPNNFYNQASVVAAMKGKLMTLTPFNDPLSPPSSASSSDSSSDAYFYGSQDNNSSSFINYHENNNNFISSMSSHQNQCLDDFCEILKDENYSVEDSSQYTTLTNAFEMYLHDQHRNYGHQHSTSSGDSRSPSDAFNPADDYDNGMQNFTQLTQLTTRTNGFHASSPITDGLMSNYDSTHGPSMASNR